MTPDLSDGLHALFFDVDGTLIDIAQRPHDVVVPHSLLRSLQRLAEKLDGALALVSGRTISDIDRLFAPLRLSASGVHGAEVRFAPDADVTVQADGLLPLDIPLAVRAIAAEVPGTLVEDKRFSAALHFRQNAEAGPRLRAALEAVVAAHAGAGLQILPGHMVFEIKRATFDKGSAIGRFMERHPFSGRTPVFLGDDVTDRPGFDAVLQRGGLAFSVSEALPGVSGSFPSPASVRHWLSELATSERSHA